MCGNTICLKKMNNIKTLKNKLKDFLKKYSNNKGKAKAVFLKYLTV